MATIKDADSWTLVPSTSQEIEAIRKKCQRLVLRRAAFSAGVSAIPLPLLDVAVDARLLATLIEKINAEFGLTSEQITRLQPKSKLFSYQAVAGLGSVLVGRMATRQLVTQLLKKTGIKIVTKNSARIVPLAGQMVSAAIGFTTFRSLGNQHIELCARIATDLATEKRNTTE